MWTRMTVLSIVAGDWVVDGRVTMDARYELLWSRQTDEGSALRDGIGLLSFRWCHKLDLYHPRNRSVLRSADFHALHGAAVSSI